MAAVTAGGANRLAELAQTSLTGGGLLGDLLTDQSSATPSPLKAVDVTGAGVESDPWVITATNPSGVAPAWTVNGTGLRQESDLTIVPSNGNYVQRLYKEANVAAGDFRLVFTFGGLEYKTAAIRFDAAAFAPTSRAAATDLTHLLRNVLPDGVEIADVTGDGSQASPWIVRFLAHDAAIPVLKTADVTLRTSGAATVNAPAPLVPGLDAADDASDPLTYAGLTAAQLKTALEAFESPAGTHVFTNVAVSGGPLLVSTAPGRSPSTVRSSISRTSTPCPWRRR